MLTIAPEVPAAVIARAACFTPKNTLFRHRADGEVPVGLGHLGDQSRPVAAGDVEHRIQASFAGAFDQRGHVVLPRDVAANDVDPASEFVVQRPEPVVIDVAGNDGTALGVETTCDGTPDSRGRARDDGGLACEALVDHRNPSIGRSAVQPFMPAAPANRC